jgi:hypothetical protein
MGYDQMNNTIPVIMGSQRGGRIGFRGGVIEGQKHGQHFIHFMLNTLYVQFQQSLGHTDQT